MSVRQRLGLEVELTRDASASSVGARRVVMTTLAYFSIRALWHAAGGRRQSDHGSSADRRSLQSWLSPSALARRPARPTAAYRDEARTASPSIRAHAPYTCAHVHVSPLRAHSFVLRSTAKAKAADTPQTQASASTKPWPKAGPGVDRCLIDAVCPIDVYPAQAAGASPQERPANATIGAQESLADPWSLLSSWGSASLRFGGSSPRFPYISCQGQRPRSSGPLRRAAELAGRDMEAWIVMPAAWGRRGAKQIPVRTGHFGSKRLMCFGCVPGGR